MYCVHETLLELKPQLVGNTTKLREQKLDNNNHK